MSHYLFVHFKEKRTPDGEQVYFGVSPDGFHWHSVNHGNPVLWNYQGDHGVRDHTIIRTQTGEFIIISTDLSLSYSFEHKYHRSWENIKRFGNDDFILWRSKDLIKWDRGQSIHLGNKEMGCLWAPDIIYDPKECNYLIHWSASQKNTNFSNMAIYYARTKDFINFTPSKLLYQKPDSSVIDSAMYEENSQYYLFLKSDASPERIILLSSPSITGPFQRISAFDNSMSTLAEGRYEAPTAVKLAHGQWGLFLDYYGTSAEKQGYVPFVAPSLKSGEFTRSDKEFSFPYGFKHGTILAISGSEYQHLLQYEKKASEY
ncbi:glycoside hydrolase family 43 protein [Lapidilactobacillus luobeiensis]|uniref:glycoside hydrolase family 43 protein n=1 Tax=Lapidilactobacillus luobeiensis TaxID=2950371 RepID=UPI0021C36AEC|nr:glycoside hydrolase family 43 protein [Lapidilactobacillus luobeiensis]